MAIYFCESSALVKRYVHETGSDWMLTLLAPHVGHSCYIARITGVEVVSAITRRTRGGDITATDAVSALAQFRQDFVTTYRIIEITPALIVRAMALAETHALRGYDAVQLAAAVEVNVQMHTLGLPTLTCISADGTLNAAAGLEGLAVEDPNTRETGRQT